MSSFDPVRAALNHLIRQTPGVAEALAAQAGSTACLQTGTLALRFTLGADGMLCAPAADAHVDVCISLPLDALGQLPRDRERAFRQARIEGNARLAETLGAALRRLRWDVTEDLSAVVGDIAAVRLVSAARDFLTWQADVASRLAANAGEYLADEAHLLLRPTALRAWADEVDRLRDDLGRLEKRLARLSLPST